MNESNRRGTKPLSPRSPLTRVVRNRGTHVKVAEIRVRRRGDEGKGPPTGFPRGPVVGWMAFGGSLPVPWVVVPDATEVVSTTVGLRTRRR